MLVLQKNRTGCLKKWQGCIQGIHNQNWNRTLLLYRTDVNCQSFLQSSNMYQSAILYNLLKSSRIQPILEKYSTQAFHKILEKEKYYYKTRPSAAGKLLVYLMNDVREEHPGNRHEAEKGIRTDYEREAKGRKADPNRQPDIQYVSLTEEQMRTMVKYVYKEVERKMTRDKVREGR